MSPRNAVTCRTITRAPVLPEKIHRHSMKGAAQKGCSQLWRHCSAVFLLLVVNAVELSPCRDQIRFVDTLRLSGTVLVNSEKHVKLPPLEQRGLKSASYMIQELVADEDRDGIPAKVVLTPSLPYFSCDVTQGRGCSLNEKAKFTSKEVFECTVVHTGSTVIIPVGDVENAPVGAAIAVGFMKLHFENTAAKDKKGASKPTAIVLDGNATFNKRILESLWLLEPDLPTFAYILETRKNNFIKKAGELMKARGKEQKSRTLTSSAKSLIKKAFQGGTLEERSYILLTVTNAECKTGSVKRTCFGACRELLFFAKHSDATTFEKLIKLQANQKLIAHDTNIVKVFLRALKNNLSLTTRKQGEHKDELQTLQLGALPITGTPTHGFDLEVNCDDVPIIVKANSTSRFYIEHGGVVRYITFGETKNKPITPIVTPQAKRNRQLAQMPLFKKKINHARKIWESVWGIYSQTDDTKATDRKTVQTNEPLSLSSKHPIPPKSGNTVKQDAMKAKKPERMTKGGDTWEQKHKPQSVAAPAQYQSTVKVAMPHKNVAASAQYQSTVKVAMPHKNVGANSQQVKSQAEKQRPKVSDEAKKSAKAPNTKTLPLADHQHYKAGERTKEEKNFPAGGKTPSTTHTQGKGSQSNTIPKAEEKPTRKEAHIDIDTMDAKRMQVQKILDISTVINRVPFYEFTPEPQGESWEDEEPDVSVKKTEASPEKHGAERQKSFHSPRLRTPSIPKSHKSGAPFESITQELLARFKMRKEASAAAKVANKESSKRIRESGEKSEVRRL